MNKSPKRILRSSLGHDINIHTVSQKTPKKNLRSSLGHDILLHSISPKTPKRTSKSSSRNKTTLHSVSPESTQRILRSSGNHKTFSSSPESFKRTLRSSSSRSGDSSLMVQNISKPRITKEKDIISKRLSFHEQNSIKKSNRSNRKLNKSRNNIEIVMSNDRNETFERVPSFIENNTVKKDKSLKTPKKNGMNNFAVIDVQNSTPLKKTLRSSLNRNTLLQQDSIVTPENPSKSRSKRLKGSFCKDVSQVSLESSPRSQNDSSLKQDFSSHIRKSKRLRTSCDNIVSETPVIQKKEGKKFFKHEKEIQLSRLSDRKSVHEISAISKRKQSKKSASLKSLQCNAKNKKSSPKKGFYKSSRYILQNPVVLLKRISRKNETFSEVIPIDDLALRNVQLRKTKSEGFKLPSQNSLKRKRYVLNALKKADEEYEDDIFEDKSFDSFKNIFPSSSESESSFHIRTPKLGFQLTPQIHAKTPLYKDCYSPTELALNRKVAEECLYRKKRKKSVSQTETPIIPEKKKLEFNKVIEDACRIQREVEKLGGEESDDEDIYFTDLEVS